MSELFSFLFLIYVHCASPLFLMIWLEVIDVFPPQGLYWPVNVTDTHFSSRWVPFQMIVFLYLPFRVRMISLLCDSSNLYETEPQEKKQYLLCIQSVWNRTSEKKVFTLHSSNLAYSPVRVDVLSENILWLLRLKFGVKSLDVSTIIVCPVLLRTVECRLCDYDCPRFIPNRLSIIFRLA